MIFDLWKTKLRPMILAKEQYSSHMFLRYQWQKKPGISTYFIIYRWVMAVTFTSILIISILGLGRPPQGQYYYWKWLIYLTHWGFTLCTFQALFVAVLLTQIHFQKKNSPDNSEETTKIKKRFRVYWVLHTIAVVAAFGITAIYWSFVFNAKYDKLDAVNLLVHAVNSVLMFIDLCIVSHPTRLLHFYWPLTFAVTYVIFSAIYFIAGGTDRKGKRYIYSLLDWQKPWRTFSIVIGILIFVIILHIMVYLFTMLRIYLENQVAKHREKIHSQTSLSVINVV